MSGGFRFGEFELDVAAYALRRAGQRIKLQKIPMEVLVLLVRNAGILVHRTEIHAALWDSDVFVDQDAAINTAVRKIRRALGDDAEHPRFIETVVGKGYRFIAPLEGSVIRDGSRIKITAQLIDGRTDRHLWAATYERELESVLAIQNDVARAVAREVDVQLTPDANARLAAATRNVLPAAYDAYVRGRHALDKRSESDLREAIRFFQQSIDADPTYAPAYAGMADCYAQLGYGSYISPEDAFPRARAAARKALELDPTLAEAHAALGYSLMYYDWNFSGAEAAFKRALELNPNSAIAHQWYAYLLTALERPLSDADAEIAIAKSLDPLSVPINIDRAYILHYYGRNEEALRSVRLALEMNPKYAPGYFWLGRIYTSEGRYADAEAALQQIGPLRTWTPAMAVQGYLYAKSGRPQEARNVLAEFDELRRQGRYASGYAIAVIYAGLGDRERVFSYLDAAYRERSHWLVWLKRDPRWNDVRSDARFQDLVRKIGLPS
jgi:DNA-binding winged helix-turn-helix (wHTH) protein/Flp pilus assembly protein TadD